MIHATLISVCSRYCIQYYDWLLTSSDEVHFFLCISCSPSLTMSVADVLREVGGLALAC
jgi:hypothetical protein